MFFLFSFTDNSIGTGAIAGITLGVIIIIILIILLTIFVIKAKRRREHIPVMYKESPADHSRNEVCSSNYRLKYLSNWFCLM